MNVFERDISDNARMITSCFECFMVEAVPMRHNGLRGDTDEIVAARVEVFLSTIKSGTRWQLSYMFRHGRIEESVFACVPGYETR